MRNSKAQIIATIGPSSSDVGRISEMIKREMNIARLNFGWGSLEEHREHLHKIREAEIKTGAAVKIIFDLPGPRLQKKVGHTYDKDEVCLLTEQDEKYIEFGIQNNIDYFALSFVGNKDDVVCCQDIIKKYGGAQKIISKIERQKGLDNLDDIIDVSDAIMVARGDLGNEVPLEEMPFIQKDIVKRSKAAGKPVIIATQMMLSMTENTTPTRAEVSDVAYAILEGADAVMLSDETASGKHPVEAVEMMERVVRETEKHISDIIHINPL